jgi:hypothetical protein
MNQTSVQVTANFDTSNVIPPPFDLTVSPQGTSVVAEGGSAAFGLDLLSLNGFTDTMNLACSVQPASTSGPACLLSPSTVSLGANQAASSTLTVNAFTTTGYVRVPVGRHRGTPYAAWLPVLGLGLLGTCIRSTRPSSKKGRFRVWHALLLLCVVSQVRCGGGGGNSASRAVQADAQPGTYTVTVTATGANTQKTQSLAVTVTVQ